MDILQTPNNAALKHCIISAEAPFARAMAFESPTQGTDRFRASISLFDRYLHTSFRLLLPIIVMKYASCQVVFKKSAYFFIFHKKSCRVLTFSVSFSPDREKSSRRKAHASFMAAKSRRIFILRPAVFPNSAYSAISASMSFAAASSAAFVAPVSYASSSAFTQRSATAR